MKLLITQFLPFQWQDCAMLDMLENPPLLDMLENPPLLDMLENPPLILTSREDCIVGNVL